MRSATHLARPGRWATLLALATGLVGAGCAKPLAPVDVSDLLIACAEKMDTDTATIADCNDDVIAGAADLPFFGDHNGFLEAVIGGMRMNGHTVDETRGHVLIQGESLDAVLITAHFGEVDLHGSGVVRGSKLSMCLVTPETPEGAGACLRVHAALLAGGRDLLRQRIAAAEALPAIAVPAPTPGCTVERDKSARGAFSLECDGHTLIVNPTFGDPTKALDAAVQADVDEARDQGSAPIEIFHGMCEVLGQRGPCARVVADGWTSFMGTAQTRDGRRVISCGNDGYDVPADCPIKPIPGDDKRTVVNAPQTL